MYKYNLFILAWKICLRGRPSLEDRVITRKVFIQVATYMIEQITSKF